MLPVRSEIKTNAHPVEIGRAVRRAIMAQAQAAAGTEPLPRELVGHEEDGSPAKGHRHLTIVADLKTRHKRIMTFLTPTSGDADEEESDQELAAAQLLEVAVRNLRTVVAGKAGVFHFTKATPARAGDPLLRTSHTWESVTEYQATRNPRSVAPDQALRDDVQLELKRRNFPKASVAVNRFRVGKGGALYGRLRLTFDEPQIGPMVLGKTCHYGGGLFRAAFIRRSGPKLRLTWGGTPRSNRLVNMNSETRSTTPRTNCS